MDLSSLPPLHGQLSLAGDSIDFSSGFRIAGFLSPGQDSPQDSASPGRAFTDNDGEEVVKCLRQGFQVLQPGHHVARRPREHGGTSFIHCRNAIQLGKRYLTLRQQLEERARVELLRDCMYRMKTSAVFVRDLQQLVADEYKVWYTLNHDCVDEIPVSKIFVLNALCEDLRTLIGHWKCIKQKLHTNRWLQPCLGSMYFQLDRIKVMLRRMQEVAIWWLEKFVLVGLKVFAHGNVEAVTHEMIFNMTRGLEDFNNIVNGVQMSSRQTTSKYGLQASNVLRTCALDAETSNRLSNLGEYVRAIPFSNVLNLLAVERSKYAALETHKFFTTNLEFVKLLHAGRLPDYIWSEESNQMSEKFDRDTSDYHTATGSMTSLSAAILKIGSIRAPDLSDSDSPIVDIARREHSFAENFLFVVCSSTNLLQRNNQKSRRAVKYSQSISFSAKPPRGDTPVLSRSDSLRKSVSWGDSAVSSIKSQLTSRYMDSYWSSFGSNLYTMFYEPCWVRQKSLFYSDLGSIVMLNTTVIALVKHMMQHVCLKGGGNISRVTSDPMYPVFGSPVFCFEPVPADLFPPSSVAPMLAAVKRCLHVAAFGAWDNCLCEALASHRSDKCYPCPLMGGDYSTRTGMLLRDTFQPVLNVLRENLADSYEPSHAGEAVSLTEVVSVAMRLVATSSASLHWCRTKTHQYLSSMAVGNFLLISQTDLKILVDECRTSLYQLQMVCKAVSSHSSGQSVEEGVDVLTTVCTQLTTLLESLQGLSGLCMKQFSRNCTSAAHEYFKMHMPTGKVWRKKPSTGGRKDDCKDHNLYMEHVLETVLEPVLEGVGKLKPTVQLSVVSQAVEALVHAWMNFILNEKIKFSYAGACQLGTDARFMCAWLRQSIATETVQQSILDLPVLKTMAGAVILLMRQPDHKRSSSKIRMSESNNSVESGVLHGERTMYEAEDSVSHVTNQNDWLALRVAGNSRGWRGISGCLNPDPQ